MARLVYYDADMNDMDWRMDWQQGDAVMVWGGAGVVVAVVHGVVQVRKGNGVVVGQVGGRGVRAQ